MVNPNQFLYEFVRYFKSKSINGAIVLREEFKVSLSLSHSYFTATISSLLLKRFSITIGTLLSWYWYDR